MAAAVGLAPEEAFYHFRLGSLQLRLGQVEEAVAQLSKAAELAPFDGYYLVRYAIASLAMGLIVESIDAFRSALQMDPRNRCYRVLLADAYLAAGMEDEAAALVSAVGELDGYEMDFVGRRRLELNQAEIDAARTR
jgi:tetratricopeptide (TPR) repeat protein